MPPQKAEESGDGLGCGLIFRRGGLRGGGREEEKRPESHKVARWRLSVFGPWGFWTMAPLRCAAKFDPILSLDCAPTPSTLAQSKERKGSNFAVWQHWFGLRRPHSCYANRRMLRGSN